MSKYKSQEFELKNFLHPKHWLMWIMFGFLRFLSLFPYSFQLVYGSYIGKLLKLISKKRRRIVKINLKLCFPDKSDQERQRIMDGCYQNIGISMLELAICWWWSDDRLRPLVEIRGQHHVDQALADNKSVILLSGHFTSLEIGGRLLSLYLKFQCMYRTQRNQLVDSMLYSKRNSYIEHVVSRKDTRKLLKGIKNLLPTWYAPDQDFRKERNVFAPFLGVPAATITASARLAKSAAGVVLPFYPERKADGSGYILWILPALENFPCGDDVKDATTINASIEYFVRQHPEHYMWIHQRFKSRPKDEPSVY